MLKYFVFLLTFTWAFNLYSKDLVLITHEKTKVSDLKLEKVKKVYMGQPSGIKGENIRPLMLSMSHSDTKVFIQDYLKMSMFEFDQYWLEKELSGQENTPKTFYSSEKLIEYIKSNKGYIAYISKNSVKKNGLKVIDLKL
ncbi:MAG: hypothetical protein MK008_02435 [Bdellovibrionales bacterium]|nr:hypothetical protein [Bdellovibrionales bacterium]